MNLNIFKAVASFFGMFIALFTAMERVAKSTDNLAKLGENYTDTMVKEQEVLNKKRIADISAKANKKYAEEKKGWNI